MFDGASGIKLFGIGSRNNGTARNLVVGTGNRATNLALIGNGTTSACVSLFGVAMLGG